MSEMVDRVRKAIITVVQDAGLPVGTYIDSEEIAKAAIAAMREPTEAMINAIDVENPTTGPVVDGWKAMIDEALK